MRKQMRDSFLKFISSFVRAKIVEIGQDLT